MNKQLTAADFAHNGQGHYASLLTTYEVYNNTEGSNVLSLVLIATDSDNNSIDCGAGPYSTWGELLTEMNEFIALDEADTTPIVSITQTEALAQLANILRIFSATDTTELLAQACLVVAKDAELDSQDVAFLEAANFHLKDAAANIYAC